MKRFLAIAIITVGMSFTVSAQEPTSRPPSTPGNTPARTTPPARTNPPARANTLDMGGWAQFDSEEGRFSVLMPKLPTEKTETKDSSPGPFTTHLFLVRDDPNVYLIGWVDYDPRFNFNRQAELEANRDNFVNGIKAKLLTSRPTTIDGYPALEFTAETAKMIFRSRVYMVGRRPYQIVIGSPRDTDDSANVNRFFNSFKIARP